MSGSSSYNVTVRSPNTDELYTQAGRLSAAMQGIAEIQDVSNDLEIRSPKVNLVIDRDKAAAVGLNATQITNVLSTGFGPKWSSTIYGDTTQYRVLIELDPKYQQYADSLDKLTFKTPRGALVPLADRGVPEGDGRPAEHQPLRAAAVGVGVVRAAARRVARRRRRSHQGRGGPGAAARR